MGGICSQTMCWCQYWIIPIPTPFQLLSWIHGSSEFPSRENLVVSMKGAQDGKRKNHHRGKYEVENGYSYELTLKTQEVI